jgi:hypothetical protein
MKGDDKMTEQERRERREYIDFMCDPSNSHNCDSCPENRNWSSWGGNLPCGQQNCWVDCHCSEKD